MASLFIGLVRNKIYVHIIDVHMHTHTMTISVWYQILKIILFAKKNTKSSDAIGYGVFFYFLSFFIHSHFSSRTFDHETTPGRIHSE